jgi:hypothetical protein
MTVNGISVIFDGANEHHGGNFLICFVSQATFTVGDTEDNNKSRDNESSLQSMQQVESSKGHGGGKLYVMESVCNEVHKGGGRSGG